MTSVRTDWISRWAEQTPRAPAIIWEPTGQRLDYARCDELTGHIAAWLRDEWGVGAGDRVAVLGRNSLEHALLLFAAQRAGFVLVPVNFRLTAPEIAHVLRDCAPRVMFASSDHHAELAKLDAGACEIAPLEDLLERATSHSASFRAPDLGLDDPAMILYTSGTTGAPKGAIISHGMLFWNAVNTAMRLDLTSSDVTMNAAPLYHTGGWNVLSTPLWHRGACVVMMRDFDPTRVLELCTRHRLTIVWGVPTMMRMLAEQPTFGADTLETVRYALVGGEPMPAELIETWQDVDVPIRQGFGMTEVGPNCFSLPEEDAIRKIGSIGTPNFYIDVELRDDDGAAVPVNEPGEGELWMRGPVVTTGYWGNPSATARAVDAGGWFRTGDVLRRDDQGYYYVIGRKKEMYISGGENVYPAEVERALLEHDAIEQAVVVGVPDERWGETGACFLVLTPNTQLSSDVVRAFARERLAGFKVPRHVFIQSELPVGASGKIDRLALARRARASVA